ncbi:Putative sterol carrier protein [Archaeoglobus sulfaticallidus PM70-1]|uniref:Putative sterol carrier protein n=1 Tax=Archaeoglobus sulfaticallidus PM70-1 TaxID=387631 RepID=N0BKQ3_9EURY|nr:SCP2 sterol-binding domain-containing protein [Archaeoglobus sulfaticallidus]AGK60790.1 Putative sterol carrier protein [Archaeoglobus sulfaticallidus PM70-1]
MAEAKELVKKLVELGNQSDEIKNEMKGWGGVVQFDIDGEKFYIKYNDDGTAEFVEGEANSPNFTVIASDEYWVKVMKGEEDPIMGFMTGKYKIQGNIMESQKLAGVMKKVKL